MKKDLQLPENLHYRNILQQVLDRVIASADIPSAVMFSGGFDSLFLYQRARCINSSVVAVTVAFENYNSRTVKTALQSAALIKARHLVLRVSLKEYLRSVNWVDKFLGALCVDYDMPLVRAALVKELTGLRCFWTGMGSDQWLGDFDKENDLSRLTTLQGVQDVIHQHHLIAQDVQRSFVFPFLHEDVLKVAQQVPVFLKEGKCLLRSLAPDLACFHPAAQGVREEQVPPWIKQYVERYRIHKKRCSL